MLLQALCIISYRLVNSNWSYSPETPNLGQIRRFLELCDLVIWRMTLHKAWNSKGEMPYCFPRSSIKFLGHTVQNITDFDPNWAFPDFVHHFVAICEFKLELQSGNAQSGSNLAIFRAVWPWKRMTLKFDGWPWKTIGYLFYATSSFVHHFVAICVFKLELQSGNG